MERTVVFRVSGTHSAAILPSQRASDLLPCREHRCQAVPPCPFTDTKWVLSTPATSGSSNDSRSITWHQWQVAYPIERNTGLSSAAACANASSPPCIPFHRVPGMLEQIGAYLVDKPVRSLSPTADHWYPLVVLAPSSISMLIVARVLPISTLVYGIPVPATIW